MTNNKPTPSVLIACPMGFKLVDGKPWFTGKEWITHILKQDYLRFRIFNLAHALRPGMADSLYMTLINSPEIATKEIEYVVRSMVDSSPPDERGKRKRMEYQKFAFLRNTVLDYALDPKNLEREDVEQVDGFDYLVSIDSDVIVHKDMVTRLVSFMEVNPKVGMVGIPVNNYRRKGAMFEYPRAVYNFGYYKSKGDSPDNTKYEQCCRRENEPFPLKTVFPVDYTGAANIIRMDMLKKHPGIRYGSHTDQKSEDMYFSWHIKNAGYEIMMDTNQVTLHMMEPEIWERDLEKFLTKQIV